MPEYTNKVDILMRHAASLGFTELTFAHLCIAAADQAGMDEDEQSDLKNKLICSVCERAIGNYGATAKDEKVTPSAGLCEECHCDAVKAEKRRDHDDEYAGMSRADADYYNSGENWRGE